VQNGRIPKLIDIEKHVEGPMSNAFKLDRVARYFICFNFNAMTTLGVATFFRDYNLMSVRV